MKDMVLIMKSFDRLHGIAWQQAYNEEKVVNSSHYLGLPEMKVTKYLHDLTQASGFLTSFRSVEVACSLMSPIDSMTMSILRIYSTRSYKQHRKTALNLKNILYVAASAFCLFFQGRANLEEQG